MTAVSDKMTAPPFARAAVTRMYTGDDGRSHFEDLAVPLDDTPLVGQLSALIPGDGVFFRESAAGGSRDFHCAPRRQFVVMLSGAVEITCSGGESRVLGAGEVLLADDTTGEGHRTVERAGPRRSLLLPVAETLDVTPWQLAHAPDLG